MCALEHLGVKREGLLCIPDAETIPSIKKCGLEIIKLNCLGSKTMKIAEKRTRLWRARSRSSKGVRGSAWVFWIGRG